MTPRLFNIPFAARAIAWMALEITTPELAETHKTCPSGLRNPAVVHFDLALPVVPGRSDFVQREECGVSQGNAPRDRAPRSIEGRTSPEFVEHFGVQISSAQEPRISPEQFRRHVDT